MKMTKEQEERIIETLSKINDKMEKIVIKLKEANDNLQNTKQ